MSNKLLLKFTILFSLIFLTIWIGKIVGFNWHQIVAVSIFFASVFATLLFWDFRVAIAFLGIAILLVTRTIDLENLIKFASLEVILFLVGMMILVGLLKESGFFAWLVTFILRIPKLTAKKFIFAISIISSLLACCVDEVTSIVFMTAVILEICDYFEVEPTPYIITSIFSTNLGSSGTVLGNPIGILIASKSGLTFEDFIIKAFPLMLFTLMLVIFFVILIFRRPLKELDKKIKLEQTNDILIRLISIPAEKRIKIALGIFGFTLLFISLHHRLELLFKLETNTLLLSIPLISGGLVMIWKRKKARSYIEKDVDWWTLLFFLLLFAKAGTLKYTSVTEMLAQKLGYLVKSDISKLVGLILWTSAIASSILDNVVLVAAFIPIIQSFKSLGISLQPLWWALLFGGCFGGNITLIGSTANIVALGMLEKEKNIKINFLKWLKIGLIVGILSICVVWIGLLFLPIYK